MTTPYTSSIRSTRNTQPQPQPHTATTHTTSLAQATTKAKRSIWDPADEEWETRFCSTVTRQTFAASFVGTGGGVLEGMERVEGTVLGRMGGMGGMAWGMWGLGLRRGGGDGNDGLPRRGEECDGHGTGEEEEKLHNQLEQLDNPFHANPNGDLHDNIISTCFVHGSKYFPSPTTTTSPSSPRHMHIISLPTYFTIPSPLLTATQPRLSTAIPTLLSHTSHACITAFLDPRIDEFIYRRELERNKAGLILVVRRQGNTVVAGAYRNFGFKLQWVAYVRSLVGVGGEWYEVFAAMGPGFTRIEDGVVAWCEFWHDGEGAEGSIGEDMGSQHRLALKGTEVKEGVEEDRVNPLEPKFMLYQSRVLARALLWDIWARFEAMNECRATWEANGVVTDVRLQRALLGLDEDE